MNTLTRRYRFRLYPTRGQERLLRRVFGCVRLVHNTMVEIRESDFQQNLPFRKYRELDRILTGLKRDPDYAFLNEVSSVTLQQEVRHVEKAYVNYFKALHDPELFYGKPGYASKHGTQSAEFSTRGFRRVEQMENARWGFVTIAKVGRLRFRSSRMLPSIPSSATIIREPDGRYYVSFVVKTTMESYRPNGRTVTVDAGCRYTASLVNNLGKRSRIDNPRPYRMLERKLARLQSEQSKHEKGSHNYEKLQIRINRLHARIRHIRLDHLMQSAVRIVRDNQTIILETLDIKDMIHKGPAQKALSDSAMRMMQDCIMIQAEKHGRKVIKVPKEYPSTGRCSQCGHLAKVPLSVTVWECAQCHSILDRDWNACVNLFDAAGLAESINARKAALWAGREPTETGAYDTAPVVGIPVL
ncbi:RNA-guided endonuclease TnpB family protein [Bifidobacterium sp. SO1]|uniref:RNA-guided endonuclease InsQ/TnpB family protein n=1 Tax=Bifidobacterium sp. SO1 TaxID=2809029 RepID=UPI001BDDA3A4|nr:RNA-guided endonuclease TnpB family protein [Bifidobacterium sp. SO1]MBT1161764.1 transposase [Bifidobacterium sp. SO1]